MKKNALFILLGLALLTSMLACVAITNINLGSETVSGSGNVVEEERTLGNFSDVELSMQGTLHIVTGTERSFIIEAQENLMEYIQTDTQVNRLVIKTQQGYHLRNTQPIHFYLKTDHLNSVKTSSSGNVDIEDLSSDSFTVTTSSSGNISIGSLDSTTLKVEISSSGDVTISNIMAEKITIRISSSGNLEILEGQVQQQTINISSSGEYQAQDLESSEADVTLTSSGTATIRVSDRLSGRLSSSGDIYYIGDPDTDVRTSSSGRVVKIK